ncbi:HAMP domain-containing histidine kinase [Paenibacillus sp. PR3]|uniref:histidine kinase n=1 Tax=Paenibacillus terricola TaxID=2763503 RepID=A0ABR8MVJ2_9BACL|nr:HAMP domain-containing histidine kinase [Paenibacillus terricola]
MQKTIHSISVIAAGNFEERASVDREDELGTVAVHINSMAERLQIQREKERRDERNRMELITGISHDLRTPLTSMIGYIHLLKDRSYRTETEYDRYVEHTYHQAIRLQKRIDSLFEYTRLTSPEAKLQLQQIYFKELLHQLLTEFQPIAAEHDLAVSWTLPDSETAALLDPDKMVRAIDNLLMNALKFSHRPGEIKVHCALINDSISIQIENDGEALSSEQEERLFDRFYRVDDSRASDNTLIGSGTGLGLAIAQSIARLHGGDLTLNHNQGHYRFCLEIPIRN